MRILIANPNTSQAVTDLLVSTARRHASAGTEIVGATAQAGFPYIATRAEAAVGAFAALDLIARHRDGYDAVVIAAFGDPGLDAARELLSIPVVGLSEAALLTSCMLGRKFGIVSFSSTLGPWFRDCVESHGLSGRLACIELLDGSFRDIADVQHEKEAELVRLCNEAILKGADVAILAGAPLSGLAEKVADRVAIPLVDGMAAAVRQAEVLAGLRFRKATAGSMRRPGLKPNKGLSEELSALFSGTA
jgi:allantoin racemase